MGLLSERCARAAAAAAGVYERPDKTSYDGEWVGDRFEGHGPPSQSPPPAPPTPPHPAIRGAGGPPLARRFRHCGIY